MFVLGPLLPPHLTWLLLLFLPGPSHAWKVEPSVRPACLNFPPSPGLVGSSSLILTLSPTAAPLT